MIFFNHVVALVSLGRASCRRKGKRCIPKHDTTTPFDWQVGFDEINVDIVAFVFG
jgi:hypothetical protein